MPTQLAKEAARLITACPILTIRSLLLPCFNSEAVSFKQIFNSANTVCVESTKEEVFVRGTQSLFTLVCIYAPTALRKTFLQTLIAGDVQEVLPLLNIPIGTEDGISNGLFIGLKCMLSEEQELIISWMETLDAKNLEKLVSGREHLGILGLYIYKYIFSSLNTMFAISNSMGARFLRILDKLSVEQRLCLLEQEGFYITIERSLSFDKDEIFIRWIFSWLKECLPAMLNRVFFLEKISFTNMLLGALGGYETTLWHILLSYSHTTVKAVINIFALLDKKNLALKLNEYFINAKITPLEQLFERVGNGVDAASSCAVMMTFLSQHQELQPLLIQPLHDGKDSLIVTLLKRNGLIFIRLFLDKALQVPIYHKYLAELGDAVTTTTAPEITQLFRCYKYLVKIKSGDNQFEAIGKNAHTMLNARFWRGGTLLHEALYNDNLVAAEFFLKEGASCRVLDKQNQTPFDLAAQHKHYDFLKKIITTDPNVLAGKGLMTIYLLGDLTLFEHAKKEIHALEGQQIISAQQEIFAKLGNETLQLAMNYCAKALSNTELVGVKFNPSFWPSIVKMTKSLSLSFIIDIAKTLSQNFEPTLDEACLTYLERSLLAEGALEENGSSLFFFNALVLSAKVLKWLHWLKKMQEKITPELDKALKEALFQTTIKTQVFYVLTLEEQKELVVYFGSNSNYTKALFTFHLRETSLCNLSFTRLDHVLGTLLLAESVAIWEQNQDSVLYMMLISAASTDKPKLYELLLKSFKQVLDKFIFLTPEKQYYCLNLACTAKVNALLLDTQNGFLREPFMQHIIKLYTNYCTQNSFSSIREDSALRAIFLALTCNSPEKCAKEALAIWFQFAKTKDIMQALDAYHNVIAINKPVGWPLAQHAIEDEQVCNKAENPAICEGRGSSAKSIAANGNISWFIDKAPAILSGVLKNAQKEMILYKWIKVSLDYVCQSGFNPLEQFAFNQFPVVSSDTGKAILSYCQLYWDNFLWMNEKQQQVLLQTMLYFAEWIDEEDSCIAPFKKSRLVGLAVLLKQYSIGLDKIFINKLFEAHTPMLNNNDTHCQEFLHALVSVIQQDALCQCEYILLHMDKKLQKIFLDRILDACNSRNHVLKADGKFLLQWLLTFTPKQKEASNQMMQNLGAQDLNLLQAKQLIKIAEEVLQKKEDKIELALYDGIWIQRLILSPTFVAAAIPEILESLLDRYKALSLLLKQDEYEKLSNRLKYIRFDDKYKKQLKEAEAQHIEGRIKRLVVFRTEDSIRALLMQLEENANHWQDVVEKKASIHVLYKYYHLRIKNMRNDLLFKVSKQQIQKIFNNIGDIKLAKDIILTWLKKHLPQCYFYQEEKNLGRPVELYNQYQKVVGYVDDSYYAMGLDAVKLNNLLPIGTVFYDKDSKVIGNLTDEGLFQADSIFQRDTAAMMLQVVPLIDLKAYPKSVDVILLQLLDGSSIKLLYSATAGGLDSEKRCFIEDRLVDILVSSDKARDYALWRELAEYLHSDKLFVMFAARKIHKNNGLALLDVCLTSNDNVRNQLLKHNQDLVVQVLSRVDREDGYLLKFLTSYYKEPWFIEASKVLFKKDGVIKLDKCFANLQKQVDATTLSFEAWMQIGQSFINNEHGAEFLLAFLNENTSVDLSRFFEKMMILPTLNKLDAEDVGFSFKVILHILKASYRNLFHYEETRLASRFAWFKEDLLVLKKIIFHPQVKNTTIGDMLFLELILRGANFGLCKIFHDKHGRFDEDLLHAYVSKPSIIAMHAQDESELQHKNYQQIQQLDERAVINWRTLLDTSWKNVAEQEKLSAFSTFLFNYEGSTEELQSMLQEYVLFTIQGVGKIEYLSKFILKFPEHPVSQIIAKVLLDEAIKTPYFLTKEILQGFTKVHIHGIYSTFSWLQWFGLQKHYCTLERCCVLLLQDKHISANTYILLKKLGTAAAVEEALLAHVNKWYFGIYAFFKRLWHGVLQDMQLLSSYIKRAEDSHCSKGKFNQTTIISYSKNSGMFVEEALSIRQRQQQLRQLREKISTSSMTASNHNMMFSKASEAVADEAACHTIAPPT